MEGAKVYVFGTGGEWQKAVVLAALGGGRYRVQTEPWEGQGSAGTSVELEVDASKLDDGSLPFQNGDMPESGFPNMTMLDHLHEAALLHNLRVRFHADARPYTYTADIVIAMNPYRWFPQLYSDEQRKEYLVFDRSKLPPHVYATSSAAYFGLQETKKDQAILVSGESGAGKTETVKILMGHLARIASSDDSSHIKRIVESNPLLESFGNAQTVRNDNSSRFGKFIELQLDGSCHLIGSKCRTYLLEKSRVVGQDAGERSYHIFYQMLAADAQTRASFGLGDVARDTRDTLRYTRLGKSGTDAIEGKSDGEGFKSTVGALALVGIGGESLGKLLQALAGVLLLGQIEFEGDESASRVRQSSAAHAADAAAALGFAVDGGTAASSGRLAGALTKRSLKMRSEVVVKPLSPSDAAVSCDALAKELYARLFDWLVAQICAATRAPSSAPHFVGLLDIFGFESFAINRFEQMCINYANEKLQQKFTLDVFKAVQQEYADEGIPWDRIEFKDNAPLLEIIEAKLGIIAMINEECIRPKGSDENFVSKLATVHKESTQYFSTPKLGAHRELQFSIRHYAGSVTYTASGWLERNKDSISDDVLDLLRSSSNSLIAEVFKAEKEPQAEAGQATDGAGVGGKSKSPDTVVTKFKMSLTQLMETIGATSTQYVRCIKPNKNKSPSEVDNVMVLEQLRCAGVIEAIRISRAGFPARMPLGDFLQRFRLLAPRNHKGLGQGGAVKDTSERTAACRALVGILVPSTSKGDALTYEVGRSRVYFKKGVLESLEERRALLLQAAATQITRCVRGALAWRRFRAMRYGALLLQATVRMHRCRSSFLRLRHAAFLVQSRRRALVTFRQRCATRLQAWQRRRVAMRTLARARAAVVKVQAVVRRRACRRQYLVDLADSKEQAKLENQVKALQARLAAQERALAEVGIAPSAGEVGSSSGVAQGEAPKELLDTLNALTAENSKLRAENEKQRAEIVGLRKENQHLRAEQAARGDLLSSMSRSHKQQAGLDRSGPSLGDSHGAPRSAGRDLAVSHGYPVSHAGNTAENPALGDGPSATLWLYKPLSHFWQDAECSLVPHLKDASEVHIKLGPNILMVDEASKNQSLMWMPCMTRAHGYRRSMAFFIERPASTGSVDNSLGKAFTLRSILTGKYVTGGRSLPGQGYRLRVNGVRPEEAAIFNCVPLPSGAAQPPTSPAHGCGELGSAADHLCVLRLQNDNKVLRLSSDGHVLMQTISESDINIRNTRITASIEYLLPRTFYEIEVEERQTGLTLSCESPLRVVDMKPWPLDRCGPTTLTTGRVHLGDTITSVSGQDVRGIGWRDVLDMIACKRPVGLGFTVPMGSEVPPPGPVVALPVAEEGVVAPLAASLGAVLGLSLTSAGQGASPPRDRSKSTASSIWSFGRRASAKEKTPQLASPVQPTRLNMIDI